MTAIVRYAHIRELAKRGAEEVWREKDEAHVVRVSGRSMGASLPNGTLIRVRFTRNPKIERGTVYYIRRGSRRIVHRIIFQFGPLCIEKGDANPLPRFCLRRDVLGILESIVPDG